MSDTTTAAQRVGVFVGTRADLGPLGPVLAELAADHRFDLHVLTGIAYAADDLTHALAGLGIGSGFTVHELAPPLSEITPESQAAHGARIAEAAGKTLRDNEIDALVVLGDRWELLYVVPAAILLGIRLVHLHGGEVTEGAIDNRIRHAISQLADEHCVASSDSAERLAGFGISPEHIHVTGAPGLDRLSSAERLTDEELAGAAGLGGITRPVALFTYHPPTAVSGARLSEWATAAADATLEACGTVIATHPGIDAGRDEILAALETVAAREPTRFALVAALGAAYPKVLASVDVVVGNSSSGVIEAATVGVPAVDIGDRQRGRLRGDNVVHADEGREAVAGALSLALSDEHRGRAARTVNPYGDGRAASRIVEVVTEAWAGVGKDAKA